MPTIPEALATARQHHQNGRLQAAEQIYRQILQMDPNQADAIHLLGLIAYQAGQHEVAVELVGRAIALRENEPDFHYNLAKVHDALHRHPEAAACYRRALELRPDFAEAYNNLGLVFQRQGKLDDAVVCYRRALELKPNFGEAHNNLGSGLREQGKLDEAVVCHRRALELKPDLAEAHNNLGNAFNDQGKVDEAVACYRRALALEPDFAGAHVNLGEALKEQGQADEAAACYRRALEIDPKYPGAHNNLGNAFKEQGKLDEAIACYRRALELSPNFTAAHSNLVYIRIFCPGSDARTIYQEHRQWNQRHAAPLEKLIKPHSHDRSPDRRLRVGYVSPNFRGHVVGQNLLPLFREHDHRRFELYCYADGLRTDELTGRFRDYADVWREIAGLSDAQLACRISEDRVDILVDLSLHLAQNRLLVFARQPAPVQVTFAGYPGTTGLSTIGYRLTDPSLDPPGLDDDCYSEKSIRLPDSFWCYDPLGREPAVNALPAAGRRYVTFGCLNNFCKVNPGMLKLWASVVKAVDRSKLMLLADEGEHRRETLGFLASEGIGSERVIFAPHRPRAKYLTYYHDIDIGLDTMPYNGHTTSLDSLWMGVPVVTLVGSTVVGRAGLSQLINLGLPELIATHPEQYVQIAADLANDLPRLSRLRSTLRARMQTSPLMDAPRFARNIEAAYRQMWRRWCAE